MSLKAWRNFLLLHVFLGLNNNIKCHGDQSEINIRTQTFTAATFPLNSTSFLLQLDISDATFPKMKPNINFPIIMMLLETIISSVLVAEISPYPVVVSVVTDQYKLVK